MSMMIATKTISRGLAHVANDRVLLAQSVVRLPRANTYVAVVAMPEDVSPYQVFQDAGQQLTRAICHLFEGVPPDHGIAIHQTDVAISAAVQAGVPVEAVIRLEIERENPRHFLWQCASTIEFWQSGDRVAEAHIKGMTLPRWVGDPTMHQHHTSAPVIAA